MYFFKILLGICFGTIIGWLSEFLNNKIIKPEICLNNTLYCVVIFLMKLVIYFIMLVGASFVGIEFMLSVAISTVAVMIITGIRNFIYG